MGPVFLLLLPQARLTGQSVCFSGAPGAAGVTRNPFPCLIEETENSLQVLFSAWKHGNFSEGGRQLCLCRLPAEGSGGGVQVSVWIKTCSPTGAWSWLPASGPWGDTPVAVPASTSTCLDLRQTPGPCQPPGKCSSQKSLQCLPKEMVGGVARCSPEPQSPLPRSAQQEDRNGHHTLLLCLTSWRGKKKYRTISVRLYFPPSPKELSLAK